MDVFEFILEITKEYKVAAWVVIIGVLFVFFLKYIDAFYKIKGSICGIFAKICSKAKKGQMSNNVRATILRSVRKDVFNPTYMPNDLKVIWVDSNKINSFISNNQAIIRIKQSSNPHENLVTAVTSYVDSGLLHNVRRYLNGEIVDASKMVMSRKIVKNADSTSLTFLDEKYINPKLESSNEIKNLYNALVTIDNTGMFTHILLEEYQKAGMLIVNESEDPLLEIESREFLRFLYDIALHVSDDPERLCFNREYFKVAIIMAGKDVVLKKNGITPYLRAIRKKLDEGIETIYIYALGRKQDIATQITSEITDYRITNITKQHYKHTSVDGRRLQGIVFKCNVYRDYNAEQ